MENCTTVGTASLLVSHEPPCTVLHTRLTNLEAINNGKDAQVLSLKQELETAKASMAKKDDQLQITRTELLASTAVALEKTTKIGELERKLEEVIQAKKGVEKQLEAEKKKSAQTFPPPSSASSSIFGNTSTPQSSGASLRISQAASGTVRSDPPAAGRSRLLQDPTAGHQGGMASRGRGIGFSLGDRSVAIAKANAPPPAHFDTDSSSSSHLQPFHPNTYVSVSAPRSSSSQQPAYVPFASQPLPRKSLPYPPKPSSSQMPPPPTPSSRITKDENDSDPDYPLPRPRKRRKSIVLPKPREPKNARQSGSKRSRASDAGVEDDEASVEGLRSGKSYKKSRLSTVTEAAAGVANEGEDHVSGEKEDDEELVVVSGGC
jgi:hypothetical protein